jgi:hypothetical protein
VGQARVRSPVSDGARSTAWILGAWGAMQLAAFVLVRASLGTLAVQAAVAEWTAGKLAVTWSDPFAPLPTSNQIARRVGLGAASGLGAAALVTAAALASHEAALGRSQPAWGSLVLGFVPALLAAVRDELLLRGMILKVGRPLVGPLGAVAVCALAATAARSGAPNPGVFVVIVEGLRGAALASLWGRDRGAWMAVGANAAWAWTLDTATRGALVDVRTGGLEPAASVSALVVTGLLAGYAVWWGRASVPRP